MERRVEQDRVGMEEKGGASNNVERQRHMETLLTY